MSEPKKSIEYLGKLEQAIKKQYGEEAIANPRQYWTPEKEVTYQQQIKENAQKVFKNEENEDKVEKDGFLISKKLVNKKNSNKCHICDKYLLTTEDEMYLLKFECCSTCYVQYVEDREERWKNGWRPTKSK